MSWSFSAFETLYGVPSRNGIYKSSEHHGDGAKIVNMGELFAHEFVGPQDMSRLTMSESELEKAGLVDGDLLFGRRSLVEAGAGKCSVVEGLVGPTTFESSIIRVRLDLEKALPRFYYYWFRSRLGRGSIRAIVSGTNVKGIRGSELKNVLVPMLDLDDQRRISDALSAYDNLIENNRRRIVLLEESARLLYREWFVHLRFPGHEHVKVVHGVPEGWGLVPLEAAAKLNYGRALKEEHRIPGNYPVYGSSGVVGYHQSSVSAGPGIIVGRKGNVGAVYWSSGGFFAIDTVYFVVTDQSNLHLYYALRNVKFMSTDVAVPGLNRDFAHSIKILIPSERLKKEFIDIVASQHEQIENFNRHNQKLSEARDLLLPRLMSGEIQV